jgi:FkbM family methyltransferase
MTLFKQAISILRAFGLKETIRRTFYYSASTIFGERLYQKPIIECIVKYAKDYPTFIDIGACRGTITVAVSHLFNHCIAIEPLPENFSQLISNVSAHKVKNCILLPIALDEKPGTKTIYYSPGNTNTASLALGSLSCKALKKFKIKTDTLDEVVKKTGVKEPYLIKIDIQGYEFKAFKGGKETLSKKCLIISEFWPFGLKSAGDDPFQYIEYMKEFGYQTYDLHGAPLSTSKFARLCELGIHNPYIVMDVLFYKNDKKCAVSGIHKC